MVAVTGLDPKHVATEAVHREVAGYKPDLGANRDRHCRFENSNTHDGIDWLID